MDRYGSVMWGIVLLLFRILLPHNEALAFVALRSSRWPSSGVPSIHQKASMVLGMSNSDGDLETSETEGQENFLDPKFVFRNKRWVVVVDDEEPIRMAVGDFLYDQGFQVTACVDADAMLAICANGAEAPLSIDGLPRVPDCIVSDIRMPGKDGIELLGLIRSDPMLATVPVVLLTAKAMAKDRVQGYQAGADAYLPKPFDPDELLSIVDNVILRRQQMSGQGASLLELKDEITKIKEIMRRNSANVVKRTDIYLTDKERDILELLCQGFTNSEIADERKASLFDINTIVQKLRSKTRSRNRTELVRWAIATGYVSPRP
jgi:DNA-binding NarL/FixJ family response regulator